MGHSHLLLQRGAPRSPAFRPSNSEAVGLGVGVTSSTLLILRPTDCGWIMPPAWCSRLWDSLDSIIAWARSCKSPLIYLPVYPTSSWGTLTNTSTSIDILLHILISYIHKVLGNLPLWEHPSTHYRCVVKYFIGPKFIPVFPWDLMQQMNKIFGRLSISMEFLEGCDFKGY